MNIWTSSFAATVGVISTRTDLPIARIASRTRSTHRVTLIIDAWSALFLSSHARIVAFVDIAWNHSIGLRCVIELHKLSSSRDLL